MYPSIDPQVLHLERRAVVLRLVVCLKLRHMFQNVLDFWQMRDAVQSLIAKRFAGLVLCFHQAVCHQQKPIPGMQLEMPRVIRHIR